MRVLAYIAPYSGSLQLVMLLIVIFCLSIVCPAEIRMTPVGHDTGVTRLQNGHAVASPMRISPMA